MKTHKTDITVHWGDCDPAVIVYYPNYFHWFDASTVNLFAAVGLALQDLYIKENLAGIPILDAGAKFIRPSRFQDVITVESGVEYWRQSCSSPLYLNHSDKISMLCGEVFDDTEAFF